MYVIKSLQYKFFIEVQFVKQDLFTIFTLCKLSAVIALQPENAPRSNVITDSGIFIVPTAFHAG